MKKLILAVGVATATLLAGCTGSATDAGSSSAPPPTPAPSSATPAASATPTPTLTPTPTPTGSVELTIEEAGQRYLEYICASNASIAKYTRPRDKFDAYTSSSDEPHPKTKKGAQIAADAHAAAAKGLSDPGFVWPESVSNKVNVVATNLYEFASIYNSIAEAKTWSDADSFPSGNKFSRAASAVRLALGLPPRGECPKESRP